MRFVRFILLLIAAAVAIAGTPTETDVEWEPACGGSNIKVARVDGQIVSISGFAEHFAEGREWQCHYTNGKIVSALYRHYTVSRKAAGDAGEFTTEQHTDILRVFHFPDHQLKGLDSDLLDDLKTVISKATGRT